MSGGAKKSSKKGSKKASKKSKKMSGGAKKSSKKGSKKSSKKGSKKSSKKMSGGAKKSSKKASKKGSKKMTGGKREMNPSMKAFLELKSKIAKALGVPNGIAPAKVAGAINKDLKEKFPDAIERAKEAFKVFETDVEKYRKML